ncbi:MAG: hypothetical protein ACKPB7_12285 [Sphaerospermopsis kisseleviana]
MNTLPMRAGFYTLSGIFSALIGWSISQIIWQEIGAYLTPFIPQGFNLPPYIILLVIIIPLAMQGVTITNKIM